MTLTLHVYAICWNEREMLPFFLEHYARFAEKIVIFDNMSDDGSPELVSACPIAEVRSFDTGGRFDDVIHAKIKSTAYKESRGQADYVVIVDMDEFVYHPQLMAVLAEYRKRGVTVPVLSGYDMVAWRFPVIECPITTAVRHGRPSHMYSKRAIISPELDVRYGLGAHTLEVAGPAVESDTADIWLLHYHYVGLWRIINRHRACKARLPNRMAGSRVAYQFEWGALKLCGRFLMYRVNALDVIHQRRSRFAQVFGPFVSALRKLVRRLRLG